VLGLRYLAVAGGSMAPGLRDGDWILARRSARVGVGDVVVLEHPGRPGLLVVKRVAAVQPDGYWVLGDHPDGSTDSRHFGAVREVLGRVVWRVRPWGPVR
jgi:nickel-type superoxide dismutase maturation protease